MTMTAYHGITLAVIAVVAIGTAMYTYFSTRNRAQGHDTYHEPEMPHFEPETSSSPETSRRRKVRNQDTCTICIDKLGKRTVIALNCGHKFHAHCIKMWLEGNKTCPVCRNAA